MSCNCYHAVSIVRGLALLLLLLRLLLVVLVWISSLALQFSSRVKATITDVDILKGGSSSTHLGFGLDWRLFISLTLTVVPENWTRHVRRTQSDGSGISLLSSIHFLSADLLRMRYLHESIRRPSSVNFRDKGTDRRQLQSQSFSSAAGNANILRYRFMIPVWNVVRVYSQITLH